MEAIFIDIHDLIADGYQYCDVAVHYSSFTTKLDALDISFPDNGGHYCFHDDILRDIIFNLELGL